MVGLFALLVAFYICLFMKEDASHTLALALFMLLFSISQLLALSRRRKLWLSFVIILVSCLGLIAGDLKTWHNYTLAIKGRLLDYPDVVLQQGDEIAQLSPPSGSRIVFSPADSSSIHYGYAETSAPYGSPNELDGVYFGSAMAKLTALRRNFPDENGNIEGSNSYAGDEQLQRIELYYVRQAILAQKQSIRLDYPDVLNYFGVKLPTAFLRFQPEIEQWKDFRRDASKNFLDNQGQTPYFLKPSLLIDFRLSETGQQTLTYDPNFGEVTLLDLLLFPLPLISILAVSCVVVCRDSIQSEYARGYSHDFEVVFFKKFASATLKVSAILILGVFIYCMCLALIVAYECHSYFQPGTCFESLFPRYIFWENDEIIRFHWFDD